MTEIQWFGCLQWDHGPSAVFPARKKITRAFQEHRTSSDRIFAQKTQKLDCLNKMWHKTKTVGRHWKPYYRFLVLLIVSNLKMFFFCFFQRTFEKNWIKKQCHILIANTLWQHKNTVPVRQSDFFCDIESLANFLHPSPNFIEKLLLVAENGGFEVSSL